MEEELKEYIDKSFEDLHNLIEDFNNNIKDKIDLFIEENNFVATICGHK